MKITIEHDGAVATVEDAIVTIDDTMTLVKQALMGVGFHPELVEGWFGEEPTDKEMKDANNESD